MPGLPDQDGYLGVVHEGESVNITGQLLFGDTEVAKSSLLSLTLTLYDKDTQAVINSRDGQDILDANGSSVDSTCNVTIELNPADSVIVGSSAAGRREKHVARLTWTWDDGDTTRTGIDERWFWVEKLRTPS